MFHILSPGDSSLMSNSVECSLTGLLVEVFNCFMFTVVCNSVSDIHSLKEEGRASVAQKG